MVIRYIISGDSTSCIVLYSQLVIYLIISRQQDHGRDYRISKLFHTKLAHIDAVKHNYNNDRCYSTIFLIQLLLDISIKPIPTIIK